MESVAEPMPVGFPNCRRCPYRRLDRPDVCLDCAFRQDRAASPLVCPICEQGLGKGVQCGNDWCGRADRWWSMVWSVGHHVGAWRFALASYKYRADMGFAAVFGRLLVGYLDEHMPWFDDYDALVPMPAFMGRGARRGWDPVGCFVAAAEQLAGRRWPVEHGVVIKVAETPAMAGLSLSRRQACAEGALRHALRVNDRHRVQGARVLVVDDVFTEGSTLREVARALRLAGAEEVAGVALARQPWGPRWWPSAAA